MSKPDPIVIVSATRTPIGNLLGELAAVSTTVLGSAVIRSAIQHADLTTDDIDEVFMGCVLPAGLGQAPARQAALGAGLPTHVPCTTLNKVCGSGMKAIMIAHDGILAGSYHIAVAGGMESMTNAPYLLKKARAGYRLGHGELFDHMMLDGLEDAYQPGCSMGFFAEECAKTLHISREMQDAYAKRSFERAIHATEHGLFEKEITPITLSTKQGDVVITKDEHPFSVKLDKMPSLKPAFVTDGTVTAGNSSSIADGAAALVLMRESDALKRNLKPLACIHAHASAAKAPSEFTTAPIDAVHTLLKKCGWTINDVDLYEVNEAFAVVALAFIQALNLSPDKVNIHGGACALGHPIGASGARIVVTLLNALKTLGKKRGVATLCIGGGEATALAVELY